MCQGGTTVRKCEVCKADVNESQWETHTCGPVQQDSAQTSQENESKARGKKKGGKNARKKKQAKENEPKDSRPDAEPQEEPTTPCSGVSLLSQLLEVRTNLSAPHHQGKLQTCTKEESWQDAWVEVRPTRLIVCREDPDGTRTEIATHGLTGSAIKDTHNTETQTDFIIVDENNKKRHFHADSVEERQIWIEKIDECSVASPLTATETGQGFHRTDTTLLYDSHAEDEENKNKKDYQITSNDFSLIRLVGKGAYGRVLKVKKIDTGAVYAMKVLLKKKLLRNEMVEYIKLERKLLSKVNHSFIVKLHWAFQSLTSLYLIMDYLPGGELWVHVHHKPKNDKVPWQEQEALEKKEAQEEKMREKLRKQGKSVPKSKGKNNVPKKKEVKKTGIPVVQATHYAASIVLAFEHMHRKGIMYRDLKPENVVLDVNGYATLTDLGMAYCNEESPNSAPKSTQCCGTCEYMLPGLAEGKVTYGVEVDWWALGVLIFEMLYAETPWTANDGDNKESLLAHKIANEPLQFPNDHRSAPKTAKDLISKMLDKDIKSRLTCAEAIKSHEFFKDINWQQLANKNFDPPFKPFGDRYEEGEEIAKGYFDKKCLREDVDGEKNAAKWLGQVPDAEVSTPQNQAFQGFSFRKAELFGRTNSSPTSPAIKPAPPSPSLLPKNVAQLMLIRSECVPVQRSLSCDSEITPSPVSSCGSLFGCDPL